MCGRLNIVHVLGQSVLLPVLIGTVLIFGAGSCGGHVRNAEYQARPCVDSYEYIDSATKLQPIGRMGDLQDGNSIVKFNDKYGLVDSLGRVVVCLKYDNIRRSNGLLLADSAGCRHVYTSKGDVVYSNCLDECYSSLSYLEVGGVFAACKNGRQGLLSISGDVLAPFDFDDVSLSRGYFELRKGECIGLYSISSSRYFDCYYSSIQILNDSLVVVQEIVQDSLEADVGSFYIMNVYSGALSKRYHSLRRVGLSDLLHFTMASGVSGYCDFRERYIPECLWKYRITDRFNRFYIVEDSTNVQVFDNECRLMLSQSCPLVNMDSCCVVFACIGHDSSVGTVKYCLDSLGAELYVGDSCFNRGGQ